MNNGPWNDDAMWTPDEEDTPDRVVREHYFVVCASVNEDGSYKFSIADGIDIDSDRPIYFPSVGEWERLGDLAIEDSVYHADLTKRLR